MIKQTLKHHPITTLIFFIIFGTMYLLWYYQIDGVLFNKPLEFHFDTQNVQVEKSEYHIGEMVRIKVNFCKLREAETTFQWAMVDGRMIFYAPKNAKNLPVGCYPEDQDRYILSDVEMIPNEKDLIGDTVRFESTIKVEISGNRIMTYHYRTENFKIVP